ncbi:MAG: hypothetical protein H6618_03495 [Deltaproteobacteria bacterium]|nr:hypothetical protein [Deltaproteobacteria bacterium]
MIYHPSWKSLALIVCFGAMIISLERVPSGFCLANSGQTTSGNELRPLMNKMFSSLQKIYIYLMQDKGSENKATDVQKERNEILNSFQQAVATASGIEHHGRGDVAFQLSGTSLKKDLSQAETFFRKNEFDASGFIVRHLVANCFSCHTRYGTKHSFPTPLIPENLEKSLRLYELARLKAATRQFDQAVRLFDQILSDPEYSYDELVSEGVITDYFRIMIRVNHDFTKAMEVCDTLLKKELDKSSVEIIRNWRKDLNILKDSGYFSAPSSLLKAKELLGKVRNVESEDVFPMQSLVLLMTASASLHTLAIDDSLQPQFRAEAYYLLGTAEHLMGSSFWLSESQYFWEASIRTLPHSELARKSFEAIEENVKLGYTGSGGTRIPEEVDQWLNTLERMAAPAKNTVSSPPVAPVKS